jgi:hypothetical protein
MFAADLPEVSNGINTENANATSLKAKSEGLVLKLNYKRYSYIWTEWDLER